MKSEINVRPKRSGVTIYATDREQLRTDLMIDVDTYRGQGITYMQREKTEILIMFENKTLFLGSIEELVKKLS